MNVYDGGLTAHVTRHTVPPLFPRPDLRTLLKPAHERLSPAFAGEPGDEEIDTAVIRDEWIRRKLDECEEEYSSSRSLR
jgi:phosphatidylinositol-bisphosphatase